MDKGVERNRSTQPKQRKNAKGKPGVKPRWTSGAKTIVGAAQTARSRIWYTINNGVLAEIYFPDVDQANTRAVRFLVTGPDGFFSDELWDAEHKVEWLDDGVPGCRIESQCKCGRYTLHKEIVTDPLRDILLMRVRFSFAKEDKLRLFLSVDPHIGDQGADNHAWAGQYKQVPMLFACRGQLAMAVSIDPPPRQLGVGYIGESDAYTVLRQGKPLPSSNIAEPGNVSLAAEIDLERCSSGAGEQGTFLVSLAMGSDAAEGGQQCRAGILGEFEKTSALFVQGWREEQGRYEAVEDLSDNPLDLYRVSTAVLECHQSKRFPGGFVASLSLPWGFARSDKDVGGYHVVWPRDLAEIAIGKLASGDARAARSALFYLACTQNEDGGWSQNMWLDGTPHWKAIQMDGIALPILLADKLRRDKALDEYDPLPMVHKAACFVLKHGPVTQQDRWETTPGYTAFTMATEIAALLSSADCAEAMGAPEQAKFLRETADAWNDAVDELTYVRGTSLAHEIGVDGYYVRIAPPDRIKKKEMGSLRTVLPNRGLLHKHPRAIDIVSPDTLALVRFGLRAADDPRILATIRVIDAKLKRETATGPTWRRSSLDGYGEKRDGSPFQKTGIGRGWPLLAGERAHYEIAAGRYDEALALLKTMSRQTSECGMIPEQVWDQEDIPERELYSGLPTGSGMPLAWAHAEYIKLLRSLHSNAIWDAVPQATNRYVHSRHPATFQIWRPRQRRGFVAQGKDLRVDLDVAARVTWTVNGTEHTEETTDSGLGLHFVILTLAHCAAETAVRVRIELHDPQESDTDAFIVRIRKDNGHAG